MALRALKNKLSKTAALGRMRNWCAYQERSHFETRRKLKEFFVSADETEEIIAQLVSDNFLNEERFALSLAGGKFRMKKWGRIRLRRELERHQIPEAIISKALDSIDSAEYEDSIRQIFEKRMRSSGDQQDDTIFFAAVRYLISRGYEPELVKKTCTHNHELRSEE